MWALLSWSQTREAVNHNPWAETEFTTPIETHLGSEARGPTIYCLWAPPFFLQSFSFGGREQINESQIHMDDPRRPSKKEIIIFEVMKVLPEVKELHEIFRPVSWSKKNISRRVLAERQIYALPQPSLSLTSPMCDVIYSISQSRKIFLRNSESGAEPHKVLLAGDVKGGNCIDLSSASFGICPPSSFFFPKVRAFVPQPPV